jgi:hypothetical protein
LTITRRTGVRSPAPGVTEPMRTSISCGGQAAGEPTAAPVIDEQWPAVSTQRGAISVPVHKKDEPKRISATAG